MNYTSLRMDELIRHNGIVTRIDGEKAIVEITQSSACASCKAQSMCMSSEHQQKQVEAVMATPMNIGDTVEVAVHERLAWRAVLLAYILPFIVMVAVIAILDFTTEWSEAVVGTLSLCAIALYYIGLGVFKHRLQRQFSFVARKG